MNERDPSDPENDLESDLEGDSDVGEAALGEDPFDLQDDLGEAGGAVVSESESDSESDSDSDLESESESGERRPDLGSGRLLYEETTEEVRVTVRPVFLDEQSEPEERRYLWAYHIRIENGGARTVQLLARHWEITDADGRIHEVEGVGVVGEQPTLAPGGIFEYTSGTPLKTPSGFMGGRYEMRSADGVRFEVRVPTFSLDSPYAEARFLH